jgi:tetratricopeptide (TPR) repeat protein
MASLDAFRVIGDKQRIALALSRLGWISYDRQAYDHAGTLLQEALVLAKELNSKSQAVNLLNRLGFVALRRGQSQEAHRYFVESLTLLLEMNDRRCIAVALIGAAGALAMQSNSKRAAELTGAADALLEAPGRAPIISRDALFEISRQPENERRWVADLIHLDDEAFRVAHGKGRSLSLEQAIACAVRS